MYNDPHPKKKIAFTAHLGYVTVANIFIYDLYRIYKFSDICSTPKIFLKCTNFILIPYFIITCTMQNYTQRTEKTS